MDVRWEAPRPHCYTLISGVLSSLCKIVFGPVKVASLKMVSGLIAVNKQTLTELTLTLSVELYSSGNFYTNFM